MSIDAIALYTWHAAISCFAPDKDGKAYACLKASQAQANTLYCLLHAYTSSPMHMSNGSLDVSGLGNISQHDFKQV